MSQSFVSVVFLFFIVVFLFCAVSDTLVKKRKAWDLKEIRSITGDDEHIALTFITRVGSDDVFVVSPFFLFFSFCHSS